MALQTVFVEARAGVMTLSVNRPEVLNAFNDQMSAELGEALKRAERDPETRAIVITGSGRGFCAG